VTLRLVLITHASTEATAAARFPYDEPLEARGAGAVASAAGSVPRRLGGSFRGPERRCEQTASGLGLPAEPDASLADVDLGTWRGRTLTGLEAEHPADLVAWLTDPAAAPHGGESLSALMDRVASWLGGLPTGPARIAAITHPAVVRAAVLHVLGAPAECFWRLDTGPLTQTWLTRHGGRWTVRESGHPLGPGQVSA
jgi:broad specificity phosphatase PhoE